MAHRRDRFADDQPSASKQFTDRETFKEAFDRALASLHPDRHSVLVFYGVGGIGKSALLRELRRLATAPRGSSEQRVQKDGNAAVVWAALDLYNPQNRDPDVALRDLSIQLHTTYGWKFPTFSIAYAHYWSLAKPEQPLSAESLPFVDDADMALGILNEIDGLKLPYVGLLTKIPAAYHKVSKAAQRWLTERITPELEKLKSKANKEEVLAALSYFWAKDALAALQQDGRPLVVALDTYEALWEGKREAQYRFTQDTWVRDWVIDLPGVLWVIAGRDKLAWKEIEKQGWTDDDLDQHLLGRLSDEDAGLFLQRAGVAEADVRAHLVHHLDGLPFNLDLSVDTYGEIRARGRTPVPGDFARTPGEVVDRFLKYISDSERATLQALSATRFWDRALFEHLVGHFKTGYSWITHRDNLERFSFIEPVQGEPGVWKMHEAMRAALDEHSPVREEAHRVAFEHYAPELEEIDLANVTPRQRTAFREGAWHARHGLPPEEACAWFFNRSDRLNAAAEWRLLEGEYDVWFPWCERVLGAEHPDALTSVNNLAALYDSQGRYAEAEALFVRALEGYERVLGAEHPDTLGSVNDLAGLYESQGRYAEAEPLYERALEGYERVLGAEHPDTLRQVNNLALLYRATGRYAEAEPLYERALEGYERVLGAEHPSTLTSVNNLAFLYQATGRYAEAEPLYERALEGYERVLGAEHPDTLRAVNNLACLYQATGRYAEAEPLYERALEGHERVLGAEHPSTLTSVNNLAGLYYADGRLDRAVPLLKRALEWHERVLGAEHPDTLMSVNNLAGLYESQGRYAEAEPLFERALEGYERVLGAGHTSTIYSRQAWISFLFDRGRGAEAVEPQRRHLASYERQDPAEPDRVATERNNLGVALRTAGQYEEAASVLRYALSERDALYGADHPDTAWTRHNLGYTLALMGKPVEGVALLEEALSALRSASDTEEYDVSKLEERLSEARRLRDEA